MTDWKKTNYGIPKTWKEIEEERIDAELAKNSASPFWAIVGIATLGLLTVACALYVIRSLVLMLR